MQKGFPNEVRGVPRSELSHGLGAMTFERPRTDADPQGALLVGMTFADKLQNLALALRQRLSAGLGRHRRARGVDCTFALTKLRSGPNSAARHHEGSAVKAILKAILGGCDLLDQGADLLGLLKRILHHLLQVRPISAGLRKPVAVFPDLAEIDPQRGQGTVELAYDSGGRFVVRPRMSRGQPKNFKTLIARRTVFDPCRQMRMIVRIIKSLFML